MFKSPNKKTNIRLKSQEITDRKQKDKDKKISRLVYRILLVLFIIVVCYTLFFSPFLQINQVYIAGNDEIASTQIGSIAESLMDETYGGYISKRNLILFPANILRTRILEKFKKVSDATVRKKFPDQVEVVITERKSLLLWCSAENCFIVDEHGYAYTQADFDSEEIKQNHLVRIDDMSARGVTVGKQVLSDEDLQFFLNVKDVIKNKAGIEVEDSYTIPSSISEEFSAKTANGVIMKFSLQFSLEKALENMELFFTKKESPAHSLSELEYVDLRYEDKIFYKALEKKEEGLAQTETSPVNIPQDNGKKK